MRKHATFSPSSAPGWPCGVASRGEDESGHCLPRKTSSACSWSSPDRKKAGLIDPGATVDAVLDAIEPIGTSVQLDFLRPPTVAQLAETLYQAWSNGKPYHVLHFDGHGTYDPVEGLGKLCFEHTDPAKRAAGETELISGAELRERLGQVPLPLALLEACQSAQEGEASGSAVATALLAAGAQSVIAMSHSVLVETAKRFSAGLYRGICDGLSIGEAVTQARHALLQDPSRGQVGGGHALSLRDWFVPVLLQREGDPVLMPGGIEYRKQPSFSGIRARQLESLPPVPRHGFHGRMVERLKLERALETRRRVLLLGVGGQGKTTLAAKTARWLVRTGRFSGGAAFVSVEGLASLAAFVDALGRAMVGPQFAVLGAAQDGAQGSLSAQDLAAATRKLVARAQSQPTVVVVDNLESLLPPPADAPPAAHDIFDQELLDGVLELAVALSEAGEHPGAADLSRAGPRPSLPGGRGLCGGGGGPAVLPGMPLRWWGRSAGWRACFPRGRAPSWRSWRTWWRRCRATPAAWCCCRPCCGSAEWGRWARSCRA